MTRLSTAWLRSTCWALALIAGWASQAHAAEIRICDDRGVTVLLPAVPQRIVSLLPSLTETVCEMGACDRLVATDRYSNYPDRVQKLPKLGGLDDVNVESLVALRPDVVLLSMASRATDRLESLGIKVIALEPRTHDDVRRVADKVGQVLGDPKSGERLWRKMEAQIGAAAQSVPAKARGMTVYYEVDSAPYAAGESSFIGHTLSVLGLVNIVPKALGPFPKLNPEYVVRANPQLIMVAARNSASLPGRPGWSNIRAVKENHLCAFSADDVNVMSRPGPRMGEAAQIMAACIRRVANLGSTQR